MTDRIKGLIVTLDKDYRDDDVECIVNAILMTKGVIGVTKCVTDHDDYMNRARVVNTLRSKIDGLFKDLIV